MLRIRQQGGGSGVLPWRQGRRRTQNRLCPASSASRGGCCRLSCAFLKAGEHPVGVGCQKRPVVPGGSFRSLPRIPQAVKAEHCHHIGIIGITCPCGKILSYSAGRNMFFKNTAGNDILGRKRCAEDVGGGLLDILPVGGIPERQRRAGASAGQNCACTASVMLFTSANNPVGCSGAACTRRSPAQSSSENIAAHGKSPAAHREQAQAAAVVKAQLPMTCTLSGRGGFFPESCRTPGCSSISSAAGASRSKSYRRAGFCPIACPNARVSRTVPSALTA